LIADGKIRKAQEVKLSRLNYMLQQHMVKSTEKKRSPKVSEEERKQSSGKTLSNRAS
jgi:hypothetical protein